VTDAPTLPVTSLRPPPRLTSVVMPVRDAAPTVVEQLDALARQDYRGAWELVVADSGSLDGTREIVAGRLRTMRASRLVDAGGPGGNGASRARNRGAAVAHGDLLAFCDADDVVSPGWLSAIARGARHGHIVAGRLDLATLNPPALRSWHDRPAWQRERPIHRFLPFASSANCAMWADVFRAMGGFDEQNPGAEDRDLAWRAQLAGYRLHFADDAVIAYRYRSGLRATARQRYRWGKADVRLFRDFAGAGMLRTALGDALRGWAWTIYSIPTLPWSARQRGRWAVRTAQRLGHVVGSIRERVVFP
jgi:glycosyltransferase involved in cell wall biosynthesis